MSDQNKNLKECPCYTCIVQAVCIGAEPSLEKQKYWETDEYQKSLNECIENRMGIFIIYPAYEEYLTFRLPEAEQLDVQAKCPMYCEWAGIDPITVEEGE